MASAPATPWWEQRGGGGTPSGGEDGSDRCWTSTRETLTCRAEPDEHGELRNKCERVRETLRHCAGRPDEVVESTREQTDGKPLEALDGAFLRPFLGREGSDRLYDAFGGMSDAFRLAGEMQRAMQELLPELNGAVPRRGGEGGEAAPPAQRRSLFDDLLPRGGADASARRGPPTQRRAWEPSPGTKYEEV